MTHPLWLQEPSTATKRILFARHGEYECNVRGTVNGDPRIPYYLTERGVDQATSLGERLRGEGIEAVITSELLRARHTAALVTKALGLPQLVNRLANEVRIGASMEGVLASVSQAALAHDPVNAFHVDGGESFSDVQERISLLISDISRSSPNTVLVVTHGWVLQAVRVLKGEISALEGALCYEMPGNCEVVELLLTP